MLASTLLLVASVAAPQQTAIKAPFVHVGDGTVLENGVVVVEDGKIKSVGTAVPNGAVVHEVDGHVAPGMIALRDATGAGRENNETTRKITPTLDLGRAFDPDHPAWKSVLSQGITTVVLTPDSSRIAGGLAAAASPGSGEVVKRGVALCLGLSSRSLNSSIEPTSYAGMYAHVRAMFGAAEDGGPVARAKAGELPVMMEAVTRAEVLRAAAFAKQNGLRGVIVGASRADETVEEIIDAKLGVVFETMSKGGSDDVVESAISMAKHDVPFAFAPDSSSRGAASMRMTAAACMRGGLDADKALAAMTSGAAALAGLGDTHGSIAAGKAADLVVWSGAPTELTSRVMTVYSAGAIVHEASND